MTYFAGDIKIALTAQDGKTTETYDLTVTDDPPSNDCKLKSLEPSEGKLIPNFGPGEQSNRPFFSRKIVVFQGQFSGILSAEQNDP